MKGRKAKARLDARRAAYHRGHAVAKNAAAYTCPGSLKKPWPLKRRREG